MTPKLESRLVRMENTLFVVRCVQFAAMTVAGGSGTAWAATAFGWPAPSLLGLTAGCLAVAVALVAPRRRREQTLKRARGEQTVTALRKVA